MEDDRSPAAPQAQIGPGTTLNNTYVIDYLIESGGMGDIYRGREIHTGDAVAIKIIRTDLKANAAALALFRREASSLNKLYHEAIVRYYGFSFDPAVAAHYLAMEFVDGPSLSQLLKKGPLSIETARTLRQRVAAGLEAAHERGIVHRDVSPDNIIVPGGDLARAKIIDFGISRLTGLDQRTIIGDGFAGKYNYVSPEQLGLAGGEVTAKSDIYSLGLVIAEAIIGRPIDMGGTQLEIVEKRRTVPDLGGVDRRVRPLLTMMLQPDPAKRPPSMAAVLDWPDGGTSSTTAGSKRKSRAASKAPGSITAARIQKRIMGGTLGACLFVAAAAILYNMLPEPQIPAPRKPGLTTSLPPASGSVEAQPTPTHPPNSASPSTSVASQGPSASTGTAQPTSLPGPTSPPASSGGTSIEPLTPNWAVPEVTSPNALPPPSHPVEGMNSSVTSPLAGPAPEVQVVDPVVRIMTYINRYDGGDCFFISPVRVTKGSAGIAGFATSSNSFNAFDEAFSRSNGFSPDVTGQIIWKSQCPAVDFLRRVRDQDHLAPTLELKSISIQNGQSLAGEIRGYGTQTVGLLQVQDDGLVRNVSNQLRENRDAKIFDVPISREGSGGPFPQMLLVVVSSQPLATLKTVEQMAADRFFAALLSEAAAKGEKLAATAKLFLLRS